MDLELIKRLEEVHFGSQIQLYMSKKLVYDNYDIYLSDLIDDYYWNFAANIQSKNIDEFSNDWQNITSTFKKYNRMPVVFIEPTSSMYDNRDNLSLNKLYTDSWLILKDLSNYPQYKSDLDLNFEQVDKNNIEEFIEAVSNGFASDDPNDPYHGLTEGYRIALRNSMNSNNKSKYKIVHFLVRYNNEVVGTATVNSNADIACIYNITTKSTYKRKGICKELMSYLIKILNAENIKIACLQTEAGFYTEQIYLNLGFKKIFEGYAYGDE